MLGRTGIDRGGGCQIAFEFGACSQLIVFAPKCLKVCVKRTKLSGEIHFRYAGEIRFQTLSPRYRPLYGADLAGK